MNIIDEVLKYKSVSIIGNYKNVGKTTTLNYIINELVSEKTEENIILGLTSIGADGESQDIVTKTKKPRIYIKVGSIIATAKNCVLNSDITKEILDVANINTPMGKIVIFRALSDGYVELAGPSLNSQIKYIIGLLSNYGAGISIIDGALSRKTLGSPSVTEATIFCSGAVINKNMNKAAEQVAYEANLLNTDKLNDERFYEIYDELSNSKISIVNKDYSYKKLNLNTTLDAHKEVYDEIREDSKYIVINGVLTSTFINNLIKSGNKYKNTTLLVVDSTKIFLDKEVYDKFIKLKGDIKVINPMNLIGISLNPTSIEGYAFNEENFKYCIQNKTKINVFNVMSK